MEGRITLRDASEAMGVSYRHAKRLKRDFKYHGAQGLVHGNRGLPSARGLKEAVKEKILALSEDRYVNFNDTHFTEKLNEVESICVSRETVRKLRRMGGFKPKRRRRPNRFYKRRARKAQEGMMVLWDGSPHHWFGEDQASCCLMAALDDATSGILSAFFITYEGSFGYLKLLEQIVTQHGIPVSIYQDRHSALHRNDDHWSLEEQLVGEQEPTQVGWALRALGITPIFALSPQAKGRVERLFGTLQDRLMAEMQLWGIQHMKEANVFLKDVFIQDYNRRFAVTPQAFQPAWRKVAKRLDIERIISFRYNATVGNDNAVRLGDVFIDIPKGAANRASFAKAKVEARQLLDGSWRIYYKDKLISKTEPTPLKEPIRARPRKKHKVKAAKEEQWAYLASALKNYKGDIFTLQLRGHIDFA